MKALLTVSELGDMLNISPRQCWRMRDSGHLPSPLELGGKKCLRWDADVVRAWIADKCPHVRRTGWKPGNQ